jgi:dTDP-4-amino-4,6-dideoxygalactose transaminase
MTKRVQEIPQYQSPMTVPFMELKTEHQVHRAELRQVWEEALDTTGFIGGPALNKFEKAFAEFCEVKHAAGVANGTDALILALKALGVGQNDEVILPANSFVATAEAIVHAGATPVFVDIHPDTYGIDVNGIEDRITSKTKVMIPVHLYGQPADMRRVLELAKAYSLYVIEDSAQAHGARYHGRRAGSFGDAACFSFYPAKNLGACGDGGAVVTNNDALAEAVRRLRDHGGLKKYEHDVVGYNSRLDTLQAAVLDIKLRNLEERNEMRRRHARAYNELLSQIPGIVTPTEPAEVSGVYHLYVIRLERANRNDFQEYLKDRGVQTGIHYPKPIHRTKAFARFRTQSCPIAEAYADRIVSLPMFPELAPEQIEYVAEAINDFMTTYG